MTSPDNCVVIFGVDSVFGIFVGLMWQDGHHEVYAMPSDETSAGK